MLPCTGHTLIIKNISTKLYENTTMTCEVTAQTRSVAQTDGRIYRHSTKLANCGDYVSLNAIRLDKKALNLNI